MKKNIVGVLLFLLMIAVNGTSFAQTDTIIPDLSKIVNTDGWSVFNCTFSLVGEMNNTGVYFEAHPDQGVALLDGFEFNNGVIEADIKGKDVPAKSFVGIAFRGVDETHYDVVYFRPFNFLAKDSLHLAHCVQYISYPVYIWRKLREEHPGKYENNINPVPDPNGFFHVKIVVEKPKVSVFVNNSEKPCLVVDELSDKTGGKVGLWVGSGSDGTFANLKIIKKNQ